MIEVANLTKRYGSVTAVDGPSLTVRPGHVTGFLGPNGAGKTTTMRIILGLDAPTSGTALVGGRRYQQMLQPLHEVGALLDANAAHPGRSAWRHVLSIAQSNGIGKHRVAEVLELTGMADAAQRRVKGYSLGMRQRLGIAAALLGDPPILIFDEPTNGLDPEGIHWIRDLFTSLASEGRTAFVSSHLMSKMALTADHLVIIGRGRLLADAPTERFVASAGHHDVLVRAPRAADLAALLAGRGAAVHADISGALVVTGLDAPSIADLAAEQGVSIHELVPRNASLEQAYLDLTGESVEYHTGAPPGPVARDRGPRSIPRPLRVLCHRTPSGHATFSSRSGPKPAPFAPPIGSCLSLPSRPWVVALSLQLPPHARGTRRSTRLRPCSSHGSSTRCSPSGSSAPSRSALSTARARYERPSPRCRSAVPSSRPKPPPWGP